MPGRIACLVIVALALSGCAASYPEECWTARMRNLCGAGVPAVSPLEVNPACWPAAGEVLAYCP